MLVRPSLVFRDGVEYIRIFIICTLYFENVCTLILVLCTLKKHTQYHYIILYLENKMKGTISVILNNRKRSSGICWLPGFTEVGGQTLFRRLYKNLQGRCGRDHNLHYFMFSTEFNKSERYWFFIWRSSSHLEFHHGWHKPCFSLDSMKSSITFFFLSLFWKKAKL